ncbi:cupredoxin domain-containing protein [Lacinutrix sp. C3R15]|uniref:cupredoxin domain-containing protein n=1 Tax=Flavobacteriaceae TaxID=49546 RepID=UPI001C08C1DE|nr:MULTISPECIES: cupredoxin domain-containing protein [Flavobacteriaceae]MBU2940856.1 cupredoxin domain-containing protein [Lacinutrix sp. C3R15]MDO6624174.1 cupredoxin domain-containing protein [Oceanihabitans sp. 1_MG-2023]
MKNLWIAFFVVAFSFTATAQEKTTVTTVALEQTKGAFTQKELRLKEGIYVFQVSNNNAAPEVGLVLVKAGDDASNPKNHITDAYVTEVVKLGKTESTKEVTLAKGTYTYFCPLNKTPQYTLTVE